MKKINRLLALVMALAMIFALCAGCGDKKEDASAPAQAAAPAAPADGKAPAAPPEGEASPEIPKGGDAGASTEAPEEFVALDPAGFDRDWAGYQAYLTEACNAETAFPDDEMRQQVKDQIAAASETDYDEGAFPYQMLIGMHIALSYADFFAA